MGSLRPKTNFSVACMHVYSTASQQLCLDLTAAEAMQKPAHMGTRTEALSSPSTQ